MARKKTARKAKRVTAPYTLVLYEEDKSIGVVCTKDLPTDVEIKKGTTCLVRNPCDWNRDNTEPIHQAVIIEFGHDIDFLYGLTVNSKTKKVEKAPLSDEALVQKRVIKEQALAEKLSKTEGEKDLSEKCRQVPNLFDDLRVLADQCAGQIPPGEKDPNESLAQSNVPTQGSELPGAQDEPEVQTPSGEKDPTASLGQSNIPTQGSELPGAQDEPEVQTPSGEKDPTGSLSESNVPSPSHDIANFFDVSKFNCPVVDGAQCPVVEILQKGTPSQLQFLRDFSVALNKHNVINETERPAVAVAEASSSSSSQATITDNPVLNDNEVWECFRNKTKEGILKYPLVENLEVYLKKQIIMDLPSIVPKPKEEKRKRKPKDQEAVYPREMVNMLLDALIPKEEMMTTKTIPNTIFSAIKCYINYRLPESERLKNATVTKFIRDHLQSKRRNRAEEKENSRNSATQEGNQAKRPCTSTCNTETQEVLSNPNNNDPTAAIADIPIVFENELYDNNELHHFLFVN